MKGEKRLKEIQQRLVRVLRNTSPENADRYDIQYEPLYDTHNLTSGQKAQRNYIWESSPNYQFVLRDKKNPKSSYQVMTVQWQDIARPLPPYGFTKEMVEEYMGGPAFEPRIKEAIEALSKSEKDNPRRRKPGRLEETLGMIAIPALAFSLFFFSSNLTGNVIIGNLTNSTSNFIGIGAFFIGLIGAFFYFRKKL